jgi:hypothetical protein
MGDAPQNTFIMQPPPRPGGITTGGGAAQTTTHITNIPAEAYNSFNKMVDPDAMFLNKITRGLISAVMVKDDIGDSVSPLPGFKLVGIGQSLDPDNPDYTLPDKDGKIYRRNTQVKYEGYNIIVNNFLMLVSEAISTTDFDPKEIDLRAVTVDGIMGIVEQIVTNWEDWEWNDETQTMNLGLAMWFNMYAISRRSTGGGKMLQFLTGIFKFLAPHGRGEEENANKMIFWRSHGPQN